MTNPLAPYAYSITSQNGEDGVLSYLIANVAIARPIFVEFGVESYREANTRFLLDSMPAWSGLVMDKRVDLCREIRNDPIYWSRNLKVRDATIRTQTINDVLADEGLYGDIGILSIDIDGQDYYVWDAIEQISARIVVIEFSRIFDTSVRAVPPYDPDYVWDGKTYGGSSLAALVELGARHNYAFVGVEPNLVNAFFVRRDVLGSLEEIAPEWIDNQTDVRLDAETLDLPMLVGWGQAVVPLRDAAKSGWTVKDAT